MTAITVKKSGVCSILAAALIASTSLPMSSAEAGPRHKHGWGHGHHGHHHGHRVRKRNNNGDLIAAGIIGLAIGAIIASEASKREPVPAYTYNQPYQDPYGDNYGYQQRQSLTDYTYSEPTRRTDGPNVITFNDPVSLEPWTPGWYEWCENRFRSFNPQRGTYRGYDGLDHFCVPK